MAFIDVPYVPQARSPDALLIAVAAKPTRRGWIDGLPVEVAQQRNRIALDISPLAVRPRSIVHDQPQEGHRADFPADETFDIQLPHAYFSRCGAAFAPCGGGMSAFFDQGGADVFPENRPAVIAAARARLSLVLRETIPEPRPGARPECMGSDPDDAGAASAIASNLARFPEKVDTTARPIHAARAIHQPARPADPVFQNSKDVVEPLQVIDTLACTA